MSRNSRNQETSLSLTFPEIILVKDQGKRRDSDSIVYIKDNRQLIPGYFVDVPLPGMQRYGTIYTDANDQWCVVPDEWIEEDAMRAKMRLD